MTEIFNNIDLNNNNKNALVVYNPNQNLPAIPTDTKELIDFVKNQNNLLTMEKTILSIDKISPEKYKEAFEGVQKHAELILDAELILAEKFKNIPTNPGVKSDKNKQQIIKEWGFTKKQYVDIQKLTKDSVDEAKQNARNEHKFVSRSDVLSIISKKHKVNNNTEFEQKTGIYETIDIPTYNVDRIINPINYCVLFANVGIGEYYLEENGFHAAVANEFLPERARWYKDLHPSCNMIVGDINEKIDEIVEAYKQSGCQMLLASPPCQTFTNAGKRDFEDPRTQLFIPTLEVIEKTMPEYVVIENVKEFLKASPENLKDLLGEKSIGDYIVDKLSSLGYTVNVDICDAADYGTAQSRKRAIFLASLNGLWKFPKKNKFRIPLFKVIGDLPSLETGEHSSIHPLHYAPTLPQCQIDVLLHTHQQVVLHKIIQMNENLLM